MRLHIYRDAGQHWRWRAVASNGRIVADGAEGYDTVVNARRAVASVLAAFQRDDVEVVEVAPDPMPPEPTS